MSLTVVVDGGASGCRLRAYDAKGKVAASAISGPASLSLGEEQSWHNIRSGIEKIASACSLPKDWMPTHLAMGLAGALQQSRHHAFLKLLPDNTQSTLVTDGYAQLLGATGGQPGVCIALGTGSVVHWLTTTGDTGMAGGWGFPAGDDGSGAWLGLQLLNYYLRERDGYRQAALGSALRQQLNAKLGDTSSSIQLWSTSKDPAKFASLVPLLQSATESGDVVAIELVDKGARECLALLSVAPDELPIYVVGGLASMYQSRLNHALPDRLQEPLGDAMSGLYSLTLSQ